MLELEKRYALNQAYGLRNEKIKISVYYQDPSDGEVSKHNCFNPAIGVFLCLFDGEKTYKEIIELFAYLFDSKLSFQENKILTDNFLKAIKCSFGDDVFIEANKINLKNIKRYDPVDFIIDAKDINLSDFRLSAPLNLNYDLTFDCPRKCIYCYSENDCAPKMRLLSLHRIREILGEAKKIGVQHITLAGGEPFARQDIVDILAHVIKNGIGYFISTKAHLTPEISKKLRLAGVTKIQVSLDSSNEKTADFLAGSKGFFKQTMDTIKNLQESEIHIRCKAVVTSYNFNEIIPLLELLETLKIKTVQITGYGMSIYRHSEDLFISKDQEQWLSQKIDEFKTAHTNMEIIFGGFGSQYLTKEDKEKFWKIRSLCSSGRTSLNILPDGKVSFCEQLPSINDFFFGDLSNQSIMEVWTSKELKEMLLPDQDKFKGTPCYNCNEYYECNWIKGRCIRDAYNIYRKKNAPDPKCPRVLEPVKLS